MVVELFKEQQEAALRGAAEVGGSHSPVPGRFLRGGCLALNVGAVMAVRSNAYAFVKGSLNRH